MGTIDNKQLRPHQVVAVNKLKNGNILCGNVGSGKSKTALVCFLKSIGACSLKNDGTIIFSDKERLLTKRDLYIITTARKRDTLEWDKEAIVYRLGKDQNYNLYNIKFVVDSWNNIKKYVKVKNAFFIFDEQRVIGRGAWVKSFLEITKQNWWILLTATPGDTWLDYIPVFLANKYCKNRTAFIRKHVLFNRFSKYPKVDKYLREDELEKFRNKIVVNMYYQRNIEKHSKLINVDFDKNKVKLLKTNRWNEETQEPIKNASEFCYIFRKLLNSDEARSKAVLNLFKYHSKIIIFYNFNYELNLLRKCFDDNNIAYSEWNGHKHEKILNTDSWIYLVQYTAGCEGWNCIETNTIIFYSLNYSYKIMVQAAGRIDRMNSPYFDLYYYYLVSDSDMDKAILKTLKSKKNFTEELFYNSLE